MKLTRKFRDISRQRRVFSLLLLIIVLLLWMGYTITAPFRNEGSIGKSTSSKTTNAIAKGSSSTDSTLEPDSAQELGDKESSPAQRSTQPMNWMEAHWQETSKTEEELKELETRMCSRILSLANIEDKHVLSYHEIDELVRPLLRNRGLIFVGDSTSRTIFGFLWCLLDGLFYKEKSLKDGVAEIACQKRQEELKASCKLHHRESDSVPTLNGNCESLAVFSNSSRDTNGLYLQYLPQWHLRPLDQEVRDSLLLAHQGKDRVVFFGMPCFHSLWSPGLRESYVHSEYPRWRDHFQNFYDSVQETLRNSPSQLFVGTAVAICDSKLGEEKQLIDAYLRGSETNEERLIEYYNRQKVDPSKVLSLNYTGTFPVWKPFRANHSCDNPLFDEAGALKCSATGLSVLEQHELFISAFGVDGKRKEITVLDMHSATVNSCDNTPDGRHYSEGLPMRRQLTLLLKAIARQRRS